MVIFAVMRMELVAVFIRIQCDGIFIVIGMAKILKKFCKICLCKIKEVNYTCFGSIIILTGIEGKMTNVQAVTFESVFRDFL